MGGVLGAALQTLAVAIEREPNAGDLWRIAWPTAIAIGAGMVLVPTALLTLATRAPASYLRGRDIEAGLFVLAVAGVAVATTQVEDPLVFAGAVVLLWAALRFGPAAVTWSGIALVATADWSAARLVGPFADLTTSRDAVVLLQIYAAVVLFGALALAFALQERDIADGRRAPPPRNASAARSTIHPWRWPSPPSTVASWRPTGRSASCSATPDHTLVGTELEALRPDDSGEHELPRPGAGEAYAQGTRLVNARGNVVWVEITESALRRNETATPLQVVVLRDVTERTNLRQQLLQAQKMESVARLAGGIAHDFNNVLSVMRGQVELLQDDLEVLSRRGRASTPCSAPPIARPRSPTTSWPSAVNVTNPSRSTCTRSPRRAGAVPPGARFGGHARARPRSQPGHPIVADPNRIEQAVLNLVVNAPRRDAGRRPGHHRHPHRSVDACVRALGHRHRRRHGRGDAAPGSSSRSSPPSRRASVPASACPPPTTSCAPPAARSRSTASAAAAPRSRSRSPPAEERSGAHEILDLADDDTPTVLVVDDESEVRALIAEVLRGSGYHVVVAADGDAAIALLERATRPVDLLVTDVVMPVMSGTDLAARVTSSSPSTRVLFVSGFVPAGSPSLRGAPLVAKPLHRAELLDAVHLALDGAA